MGDGKQGVAVGLGLLAILVVGFLLLSGNQVSRILSTVGGALPPHSGDQAAQEPGSPGDGDVGGRDQVEPLAALRDEARIVYTGSLELVVSDLPAALRSGRAAIAGLDGYGGRIA